MHSEFIFDRAPTAMVHASTLVETDDHLVAAWFGGTTEGAPDTGIWLSRHADGCWSPPLEAATGSLPPSQHGYPGADSHPSSPGFCGDAGRAGPSNDRRAGRRLGIFRRPADRPDVRHPQHGRPQYPNPHSYVPGTAFRGTRGPALVIAGRGYGGAYFGLTGKTRLLNQTGFNAELFVPEKYGISDGHGRS
ncbi:MAG: exo-alpha-sialidase [Methylothermaceae bacterium]|nr:exo-alpha-sialidase [Methylothermaceae bacterium]